MLFILEYYVFLRQKIFTLLCNGFLQGDEGAIQRMKFFKTYLPYHIIYVI